MRGQIATSAHGSHLEGPECSLFESERGICIELQRSAGGRHMLPKDPRVEEASPNRAHPGRDVSEW